MKRAIIFYNGDLSNVQIVKKYIKKTDYIICADGGAKHVVQLGITPNVIIGDFDSLEEKDKSFFVKQNIPFITFNKEKDETDSELALRHSFEKGYTKVLLFGTFGSRIDHMLTNIFALDYLAKKDADVTIVEGNQEIRVVTDRITLHGTKGDLVSLIPLRGNAKKVTTKDLYYPLTNEDLLFGYSRGISNVFLKNAAEISLQKGSLLVIHTKH